MIDVLTIGQYALSIAAILGLVGMIVGYGYKKLVKLIKEVTAPIQKNANGGQSLADVHKRLQKLEDNRNKRLDDIEELLNNILELVTKPKRTPTKKVDEKNV